MNSEAQTLRRLNTDYPHWRTWRSLNNGRPAAWVATNATAGSQYAATLFGDTAAELEDQLRNPPLAFGRSVEAMLRAAE